MILDHLANCERYLTLHPRFGLAFDFLKGLSLGERPLGEGAKSEFKEVADGVPPSSREALVPPPVRHVLLPDLLAVTVEWSWGRGRGLAPLEAHRRMIDIQLVLEGQEEIGWRRQSDCCRLKTAYDSARDIEFYDDAPSHWFDLGPGEFCIFFPSDAHAPLAGAGKVLKAIAKVAVI